MFFLFIVAVVAIAILLFKSKKDSVEPDFDDEVIDGVSFSRNSITGRSLCDPIDNRFI